MALIIQSLHQRRGYSVTSGGMKTLPMSGVEAPETLRNQASTLLLVVLYLVSFKSFPCIQTVLGRGY